MLTRARERAAPRTTTKSHRNIPLPKHRRAASADPEKKSTQSHTHAREEPWSVEAQRVSERSERWILRAGAQSESEIFCGCVVGWLVGCSEKKRGITGTKHHVGCWSQLSSVAYSSLVEFGGFDGWRLRREPSQAKQASRRWCTYRSSKQRQSETETQTKSFFRFFALSRHRSLSFVASSIDRVC